MLHFTYPAAVTAISFLFFKTKIGVFKGLSAIIAVTGILLLIGNKGEMNILGLLLALGSAITYSLYVIGNKRTSIAEVSPFVSVVYMNLFSSLSIGFLSVFDSGIHLINGINQWGAVLFISVICTVIPCTMLTKGIRCLGPEMASMFNMTEPLVCLMVSVLFLNEELKLHSICGCLLVLLSIFVSLISNLRGKENREKIRIRS